MLGEIQLFNLPEFLCIQHVAYIIERFDFCTDFQHRTAIKYHWELLFFQYSCRKLFPCDILGNQCMANSTRRHCKWKDSELTSYSNISLESRKPCMDIPNIPVAEFRLQLWPIENKSIVHNWKNLFVRWWVVIIEPLVCINDWLTPVSF